MADVPRDPVQPKQEVNVLADLLSQSRLKAQQDAQRAADKRQQQRELERQAQEAQK